MRIEKERARRDLSGLAACICAAMFRTTAAPAAAAMRP